MVRIKHTNPTTSKRRYGRELTFPPGVREIDVEDEEKAAEYVDRYDDLEYAEPESDDSDEREESVDEEADALVGEMEEIAAQEAPDESE